MPTLISPTDLAAAPFLSSRRTRNKVGEVDRARLAEWYVIRVAGGDRNPARTLADRYPDTSVKTWANHFTRLRSLSPALLTDAPRRGVAGGVLTHHAERLLNLAPEVPAFLEDAYRDGREVYAAPVRVESFKREPRRSWYATDADFESAWSAWEVSAGELLPDFEDAPATRSVRYVEVGPETVEDFEDWWTRMVEDGVASNG